MNAQRPDRRSRIADRIAARKKQMETRMRTLQDDMSHAADPGAMSEEDRATLDAFETVAAETARLLRAETEAVRNGEIATGVRNRERKTAVIETLEDLGPLVEPFMAQALTERETLKPALVELKEALTENAEVLLRTSAASAKVVEELRKIHDRRGLNDLYNRSGERLGGSSPARPRLDTEM